MHFNCDLFDDSQLAQTITSPEVSCGTYLFRTAERVGGPSSSFRGNGAVEALLPASSFREKYSLNGNRLRGQMANCSSWTCLPH